MDLLYWIAVLFWGWRVILLQKGGLGVLNENTHRYIEQKIGTDCF